jgi:hypothetical protein
MTSCIMTDTTSSGITCSEVDAHDEMSRPSTAETNAVAATAINNSMSPDPSTTAPTGPGLRARTNAVSRVA